MVRGRRFRAGRHCRCAVRRRRILLIPVSRVGRPFRDEVVGSAGWTRRRRLKEKLEAEEEDSPSLRRNTEEEDEGEEGERWQQREGTRRSRKRPSKGVVTAPRTFETKARLFLFPLVSLSGFPVSSSPFAEEEGMRGGHHRTIDRSIGEGATRRSKWFLFE